MKSLTLVVMIVLLGKLPEIHAQQADTTTGPPYFSQLLAGNAGGLVGGLVGLLIGLRFDRKKDMPAAATVAGTLIGWNLGVAAGVKFYSDRFGHRGSYLACLGGSAIGTIGMVGGPLVFFTSPAGAVIGYNMTKKSKSVSLIPFYNVKQRSAAVVLSLHVK